MSGLWQEHSGHHINPSPETMAAADRFLHEDEPGTCAKMATMAVAEEDVVMKMKTATGLQHETQFRSVPPQCSGTLNSMEKQGKI